MSKDSDLTAAERQKNYREAQKARGLVAKHVWIPVDRVDEVMKFIADMMPKPKPKAKPKPKGKAKVVKNALTEDMSVEELI